MMSRKDDSTAWQELKTLLSARVDEGLRGRMSAKGVDGIVDDELRRKLMARARLEISD